MSLSDELIEQETYIEGGKTIRRYKYVGEDLVSDRVKALEKRILEYEAELSLWMTSYKSSVLANDNVVQDLITLKKELSEKDESLIKCAALVIESQDKALAGINRINELETQLKKGIHSWGLWAGMSRAIQIIEEGTGETPRTWEEDIIAIRKEMDLIG